MKKVHEGAGFDTTVQERVALCECNDGAGAVALYRITDSLEFANDTGVNLAIGSLTLVYHECEDTTIFLLGKIDAEIALIHPDTYVNHKVKSWSPTTLEGRIPKTYVGLAMSSTMFSGDLIISRREIQVDETTDLLGMGNVVSCFNPSHVATIEALKTRFNISVDVPEVAPKVTLEPGDTLVVLSARFSRRLNEGEQYSPEEVESANFEFVEYRTYFSENVIVSISRDTYVMNAETGDGLGYLT